MLPVKQFTDFIELNKLFKHTGKVLAAVSGGMDSVLMAHFLKAAGYNFSIAHCNFQLRGNDAITDQAFCKTLALQLGVPFYTINFDTINYAANHKISIQMAARDLRYQWFQQIKQQHGYDVIALAHHQNDTIETILLNLTRGTGIAGLHGILPKNGNLVRPLLFLNRNEIQQLIQQNNLPYVEDSSNSSVKYARNKIRHEIIPGLKELNPGLEKTFQNNLQHFREMETLLELKLSELNKDLFIKHGDEFHLPLEAVKKLEPKRLLLFNLLQPYGFNETTIDDLITSLDKHSGRIFESLGFRLILDRENIILSPKMHQSTEMIINANEHEVSYNNYKITLLHDDSPLIVKDNPLAVSIDTDLLIYPLTIRAWQQSDYFYPLGMKTKKKLSDYFIDQKIPVHQKIQVPLLVNGNGDIIWVAGYRTSEHYKVSKNTKKVTIFELIKT
ncbi:MAG: tRNA lysidine(34) synthetase TilS [Sphingobacteriales bacterium]